MNFTEFIGQNHPDPDSLLNPKIDQLCKLAEDYAEYKQLLQSRVVGRSEQLTCKNHPYGNTYTSITGALCCVECFDVIKAS